MKQMKKILFAMVMCVMCMGSTKAYAEDLDFTQATKLDYGVKTEGEISADKETDFYAFTTTKNNSFYELNIINTNIDEDAGIYVNLWNADHSEVLLKFAASVHTSATENIKLIPETNYYIEVYSCRAGYIYGTGDYKITVTEVQDDGMDTMETATEVSIKDTYTNKIEEIGDRDFYYFETSNDTEVYSIKLINKDSEKGMRCQLYDEDGVRVTDAFYVNKNGSSIYTYKLNKEARYYIEFSGENALEWKSIGNYKYSITKTMVLNNSATELKKDSTSIIKAVFSGNSDEVSSIKWTSSNKKILTVTSKGTIKGISKGTAKVTCKYVLKDGTTITRTCTVTVK